MKRDVLALPHRPRVAECRSRDQQRHRGVADAERREALAAPRRARGRARRPRRRRRRARPGRGPRARAPPPAWASKAARNASRRSRSISSPAAARWPPWRSRCSPQAFRPASRSKAGIERPGAGARVAVERDQHGRAVVALGDPRGDDPDHARVPALAGEHVGGALARRGDLGLGLEEDARLDVAALGVGAVELLGDRGRALRRPPVRTSSRPGVGAVQAPRGVDPRREAEADRARVEPLPGRPAPRASARAAPASPSRPARAGPRARGGGSRRAAGRSRRPSPAPRGRGPRRRRPSRPPLAPPSACAELVATAGRAQVRARVAADGRVDDRRVGQRAVGARAVVVGDDHVDAGRARGGDLLDGGDRAVDGDQQAACRAPRAARPSRAASP